MPTTNVSQLIALLQQLDPEMPVLIAADPRATTVDIEVDERGSAAWLTTGEGRS